MTIRSLRLTSLLLLFAFPASARVISYSPYTDRSAVPALQHRMNRYFVLVETVTTAVGVPVVPPTAGTITGQVVLYDFQGESEPKVIFPPDQATAAIAVAAVRESREGIPSILIQTNSNFDGQNLDNKYRFFLSTDGGTTWKPVSVPAGSALPHLTSNSVDVGGPYARSRHSPVRVGSEDHPFAVLVAAKLYLIRRDGTVELLYEPPTPPGTTPSFVQLIGTDSTGTQFLLRTPSQIIVARRGGWTAIGYLNLSSSATAEGWIAADGRIYLQGRSSRTSTITEFRGDRAKDLLKSTSTDPLALFAIPTFDYSGAWIIERGPGQPTSLSLHTPADGLVKQWEDITAPQVEALHAGSSGTKVLIQVHRPRPQILFLDPALAIWTVGEPAPRQYDELFMNEQVTKGFVHLDVEAIAAGEPFVFDSGFLVGSGGGGGIISPVPSPGGGDVVQEWGVVRASLRQRLVLPSIGRTGGAFGSFWLTDLIVYNPLDTAQNVDMEYVPNGSGSRTARLMRQTIALEPREIRHIEDALLSLFGISGGTGALFIDPEGGVGVTSRTYSRSDRGTYGFAMNAVDFFAGAASPRFPVSFAGAFPGANFRTNMTLTDTSGRGTETTVSATGFHGPMGSAATVTANADGHIQFNRLQGSLGLQEHETGALLLKPKRGTAIGSVFAVDNRTNDPTYFPPDLPAPVARTIPAIGHVDGAHGSKFRSDLYLFNPSAQPRLVTLQVAPWDVSQGPAMLTLTLLPQEARVIHDVLRTAFGRTGIARLRYQSMGATDGVRVTSRTYSIDAEGGTYGFLMPPLNNFQSGTGGDTLEILGAVADERYRTNIGLVEMSPNTAGLTPTARIEIIDATGKTIDSFSVNVPRTGGMQLNDIFRSRSLSASGPVRIRVMPLNGAIGAYATFTDNQTNDSIYLAANLASTE